MKRSASPLRIAGRTVRLSALAVVVPLVVPLVVAVALLAAACAPGASRSTRLAEAGSERTTTGVAGEGWEGYLPAAPDQGSGLRPRPEDAPDLVIIAFSGHCGLVCRTEDTWSYLDTASEETGGVAVLDALVLAYERLGLSVETFSVSSFVTSHYSKTSDVVEPGYLQAQAYLDDVKRE